MEQYTKGIVYIGSLCIAESIYLVEQLNNVHLPFSPYVVHTHNPTPKWSNSITGENFKSKAPLVLEI